MPVISNLPGVFPRLQDGNLSVLEIVDAPAVLLLGTASSGPTGLYRVKRGEEALGLYGQGGTLGRGIMEASKAGSRTVFTYRIGATPAMVQWIGNAAATPAGKGITITTVSKDAEMGEEYYVSWDDSNSILRIWDLDGNLVYSNDPDNLVDAGELIVEGDVTDVTGPSFGTQYEGELMKDLPTVVVGGNIVYTPGTDGTALTREQIYEALQDAYLELEAVHADIIVPLDVYLDDANLADDDDIATLTDDYLGWFNAEEEDDGTWTYTWDNAGAKPDDYHEVNFAHQLANFCYQLSTNEWEAIGVIGTLPPVSRASTSVNLWVGKDPVYNTDGSIQTNGTGLLGNKFMVGIIGRAKGFFATGDEYLDGTVEQDDLSHDIDIGKYLSVVPAQMLHVNNWDTSGYGYVSSGCTDYAALVSQLDTKSAPTNKFIGKGGVLPYEVHKTKLDKLVGAHYVMFQTKPQGVVVVDAPTAATSDSDWQRLTTVRIVHDVIREIRALSQPFLGEGTSELARQSLEAVINGKLGERKKRGYFRGDSYAKITATRSQAIQGEADCELSLAVAFEWRRINLKISLSA